MITDLLNPGTFHGIKKSVPMPPITGKDAAAERRIASVLVPFLNVDPESLWILVPVFFDPPTAAAAAVFLRGCFQDGGPSYQPSNIEIRSC